jgi:hypothetical protein
MKSQVLYFALSMLFVGCAWWKKPVVLTDQSLLHTTKPQWFSHSTQYQLQDLHKQPRPHLFFDVGPEWSDRRQEINFYPLALEGEKRAMELDPMSGQRFFSYEACAGKDVWGENDKSVRKWPYTMGYVPRMLDQTGQPQKVIVFGGHHLMSLEEDIYYRVRVIGGVVEQVCPAGRCTSQQSWLSRIVLIAIFPSTPEWDEVHNIDSLLQNVEWDHVRYAMENLGGGNRFGEKLVPATKVSKPFVLDEVMTYLKERRIVFAAKELVGLRSSCAILYEKMWQDVGVMTLLDKSAQTVEDVKVRLRMKEELKRQRKPAYFNERLAAFLKTYSDDFATCSKFHYLGNVNVNPERFWFLSFMQIFIQLHKEGYFFDCDGRSWQLNSNLKYGEKVADLKKDIFSCTTEDLDWAFAYLGVALKNLRVASPHSFRFIDYDNHQWGSHQKLYTWVKEKNRMFSCNQSEYAKLLQDSPIMPSEIKWQKRYHKDKQTDMGIIE